MLKVFFLFQRVAIPVGLFLSILFPSYTFPYIKWCAGITNNIVATEPWWLSGLMCQSIINPMLKAEGSNPGPSILKFVLFQVWKWLCLDKNDNVGISVALLVLSD